MRGYAIFEAQRQGQESLKLFESPGHRPGNEIKQWLTSLDTASAEEN
jgi:hypothetical protein